MKEALSLYESIVAVPENEFAHFNEKRKKEIVEYHLKNTSYYRKLIGNKSFNCWEDLPVMTKKDFQQPLAERLSTDYTIKNCYINSLFKRFF